ncbi:MAG: hypothetical protein ABI459_11045, partial [Deltaproteobacteria bacterium]
HLVGSDVAALLGIIEARRRDVAREVTPDLDSLLGHLGDLTAGLMQMASVMLGAQANDPAVKDVALAGAIANWITALPALQANGLHHWPKSDLDAIQVLATEGERRLNRADQRAVSLAARPALWPAFAARHRLSRAKADPERALNGTLGPEGVTRSLLLIGTRLSRCV